MKFANGYGYEPGLDAHIAMYQSVCDHYEIALKNARVPGVEVGKWTFRQRVGIHR